MSEFVVPSHILIGSDALKEAKPFIQSFGKKAFIVTGKHIGKSEMMKNLTDTLTQYNVLFDIFDGITGEPNDSMIKQGLERYRNQKCDFLIGMGGGSPLDSAKAIGAMITNKGNISDYNGKEIPNEIPPLIAIPTTAGTGSEATKFTVITDSKKNIKMLLKGENLVPRVAIVNYKYGLSTPKLVTAATGLDALTHAVEAFTSVKATPLTDDLAISAVKRIFKYLPIAYQDGMNEEAREQMAIASLEAGICINNSSVTLVHGMSRPIGALFHVAHGMSNAMLISTCLRFAVDEAVEKFEILARETNVAKEEDTSIEASYKFIDKIQEICNICEIPTLSEYGIDKTEYYQAIDKMAEDAIASGSPGNTRKKVTKTDCINIYKKLYS